LLQRECSTDCAQHGLEYPCWGRCGEERLQHTHSHRQLDANGTGQCPAPCTSREHNLFRLHETLPGLRSNNAVSNSLQGETLGAGPIDGTMPFCCISESTSGEPWICLTGSRAEAASGDLLTQSRHTAEDRLSIHKGHVDQPQFVLALHKGVELFGLDLVLCQQQVASLAILEIRFQFLCQCGPTRESCTGECRLSRFHSLGTHASGTGPGGCWLYRDLIAFHDEDIASLPGDVIGDGTAGDPTTNDQDLNRGCCIGHPCSFLKGSFHMVDIQVISISR